MKRYIALFLVIALLVSNVGVAEVASKADVIQADEIQVEAKQFDEESIPDEIDIFDSGDPDPALAEEVGSQLLIDAVAGPEATAEPVDNGVDFTIADGVLTKYTGKGGAVTIPDGVTRIDKEVFSGNETITSVKIPAGVTDIGEAAFYGCENLTSVDLPDSLTTIGEGAFGGCESLAKIKVPKGVTSVGSLAFLECHSLTSVVFAGAETQLGELAFEGCRELTDVTLPKGLTKINERLFRYCENLARIEIPETVTSIGASAFAYCKKLESVTIPDKVTKIEYWAFFECSGLKSITIPKSVTTIGSGVFEGIPKLTIHGYTGSKAETYAKKHNIPFVVLVSASIPKKLTLGVKETYALDASGATFKSSDTAVASVSKKGVVTAEKTGSATITVKADDKKLGECKVTVVKAPTEVSFAEKSVTLGVKETLALTPTLTKGTHASYTWSAKDKKIATVGKDGVVKGVKAGTTTVTVETHNGLKATITVKVVKAPTKVSLKPKSVILGVEEALTLTPTIPKGSYASYTWTTKDKKIATVSKDGKIIGKKAGNTTVTVKTQNGKKASVKVTVVKAPGEVSFGDKSMSLGVGERVALAPVLPEGSHASYTWAVKDKEIATISESGEVKGVKVGETTVTVKTHNGKKATLTVKVMAAPDSVTLSGKSRELAVGGSIMLMSTLPENTASRITWTSSEKSVATVDADGVVRALKKGTAKITAKTFNGKKAICTIKVNDGPASLAFEADDMTIGVKEQVTLKPQVNKGAKATYTWTTDNAKVAKVSKKGVVTGVKVGSANITAKAQNGLTATLKVTVLAAPSKVTLSQKKATLAQDQTLQLKATLPKKTSSQIKWTTSAKKVATVDADGLVTAVAPGKATITAETFNGKKATCAVTVREATMQDYFSDLMDVPDGSKGFTEVNDISEWKLELIPADAFDGSEEMTRFVEEQNALTMQVNASIDAYQAAVEELAEAFADMDDALGKTKVKVTDDGFDIDNEMMSFSVITNTSGKAEKNATNGIRISLDGSDALLVPKLAANGLSPVPNALEEGGWSGSFKELVSLLNDGFSWLQTIGNYIDAFWPKLQAVQDAATKWRGEAGGAKNKASTTVDQLKRKKVKAKPAELPGIEAELELAEKELTKATKLHDLAKGVEKDIKWMCKTFKGFIGIYQNAVVDVALDLAAAKDLVVVQSHGHPVEREADDSIRSKYAEKLAKAMTDAGWAVFRSLGYYVVMLVVNILTLSPQGKAASLLTRCLGKKVVQWIVSKHTAITTAKIATTKWGKVAGITAVAGVETKLGSDVQKTTGQVQHYEDILHGNIRGTISGVVVDAGTKKPLAGVVVKSDDRKTTTKSDGSFVISVMYGNYAGENALKATMKGYVNGKGTAKVDEKTSDPVIRIEMKREDGIPIDEAHFPDSYFRWYIRWFDTDGSNTLSKAEISKVKTIKVANERIASLKGIEYLTALEELDCSDNYLTSLDIRKCTGLRKLYCDYNELTSLNVRGLSKLENLYCSGNVLTSLDVSGLSKLENLYCSENQLTSLNVSGCAGMKALVCEENQLTSLNVSGLSKLNGLICNYNKLTSLDVSGLLELWELECISNRLTSLNVRGCKSLEWLECYGNHLTSLDLRGTPFRDGIFSQVGHLACGEGVKIIWPEQN